ncbi:ICE-like protease (caspase) p20 domain protein [Ceratobasidium sp. AG-Ba]|nr:ICE-like protease (caspase) p20 domain protein [Ceratobasidium sp. AG-Ba]
MTSVPDSANNESTISQPTDDLGFDPQSVATYVRDAIAGGSVYGQADRTRDDVHAYRRALIVAPSYQSSHGWLALASSAADLMLIHKALVHLGYQKQDIRVLSDTCIGFSRVADPTRENVGFEWLTDDTQSGDVRFFYFSGYSESIYQETDHGQPKRAHRVPIGRASIPSAYHHYTPTPDITPSVASTPTRELPYYSQALVTRFQEWRPGARRDALSKILIDEINQYMSRLPAGSTFNCVLDCSVGAKNPGLKKKTPAWTHEHRGQAATSVAMDAHDQPKASKRPVRFCKCHLRSTVSPNHHPCQTVQASGMVLAQSSGHPSEPALTNEIPAGEFKFEPTRAKTLVWTAWQQRRLSTDPGKFVPGTFTEARVCRSCQASIGWWKNKLRHPFQPHQASSSDLKCSSLMTRIEHSKELQARSSKSDLSQFVQVEYNLNLRDDTHLFQNLHKLWASLEDASESEVDEVLQSPAVL